MPVFAVNKMELKHDVFRFYLTFTHTHTHTHALTQFKLFCEI